jgi:hypothetical protein
VAGAAAGAGHVAGYTVLYESGVPVRTVAVVDRDDGRRSLAESVEPDLARRATEVELAGTRVRMAADGSLTL